MITPVGLLCFFFMLLIGGAAVWIGKLSEKIKEQQKAIDSLESIAKYRREYIDHLLAKLREVGQ